MDACSVAFALALLASPPDAPEPPLRPGDEYVLHDLKAGALALQLLDPREAGHFLVSKDEFASDVAVLRARYRDLKDAPRLEDVPPLPPRDVVCTQLAFNLAYDRWLGEVISAHGDLAGPFRMARKETKAAYDVLDAARDATCDFYYVTQRRQALLTLKRALAPEDYAAGRLPFPVPLHYFRVVK